MKIKPRIKEELKRYLLKKTTEEEDKVKVISAYKLSQEELRMLQEKIPSLVGKEMVNIVDTQILGGLVIKQGSKIIDLTLASYIKDLQLKAYETV